MQPVQQQTGQGQKTAAQEPLRRRINGFLQRTITKFRVLLLVIVIAGAAFIVGYFVYDGVNKKVAATSTLAAEGAQTLFDKWQAETDAAKKAVLEKDLGEKLNSLISRYPRQYGGQRGLFLRAQVGYEKKDWDAAVKDYTAVAARFAKSYLAPVSLFDAGVSLEAKGDKDQAQKLYVKAYTDYKDSTVAPRALFDAARLDEAKGAWTDAQKKYEQLDSQYAQSWWTKLARNRVVDLKAQGKIK
jgi:TolA-binding protein